MLGRTWGIGLWVLVEVQDDAGYFYPEPKCGNEEQLTKSYYMTLWEKSKPLWIKDSKCYILGPVILELISMIQYMWNALRGKRRQRLQ